VTDHARRTQLVQRIAIAALLVVLVPIMTAVGSVADELPVREGEPSPRTVFAEEQVRIVDNEATDTARRTAAESVEPFVQFDREAQSAIVAEVRAVFVSAREVREPVGGDEDDDSVGPVRVPSQTVQLEALQDREPELPSSVVTGLVGLGDAELEAVERETIAIAQELARQRVSEEQLDAFLDEQLPGEVALRSIGSDTAEAIVVPLIETQMLPTITVDPDLTAQARERAADEVPDVTRVWRPGEAIVREGEVVDPMQYRAVEQLGLDGSSPLRALGRAMLAMLLVTLVGAVYLWRMQPRVWGSAKKLLLLGLLVTGYAALVVGTSVLVGATSSGWAYVVPAGALGMLAALLIHPVVGIATMLPAAVLVLLVAPTAAPVALFAAAAVLVSVPLTTGIAARSDLRSATVRAGLSFPLLALATVVVFGPRDDLWTAVAAAAINGVVTAVVVQGALPFLETLFRLPTVTALLDLADRNHPLLRELEREALGSYNHSVMVASLTERACREVGADPLLGSVAALYHDIGKVRQPHFFIENQQGIANPHDELEPQVSALIIQNHVVDGVELATEHRLPPEVVACIGSHHGTMLVSFFYDKAVRAAGGDRSAVDEAEFRYKGTRPRSKEAAILLLADCSEATTRSMAMSRGTLPRTEIEATVDRLLQERIDDGQFDDCDLTFRELRSVRDTIVGSLVGIYHPRIAYPADEGSGDGHDEPAPAATPHAAPTPMSDDGPQAGSGDSSSEVSPARAPR
jgi:putative nucleotidyltransferase with HDIG domain